MAAAWFRTFVDLSFSSPPVCAFSLGVPALSSAWLGAVSHSSFRAFVRYWPVLMCAVSPTSRCLRAAPLCATGLSCCIPPLSSAWPLAIHVFSFRSTLSAAIVQSCCGVHLMLSAGPLAVSFTYFSLLCQAAPLCAIGQSCCVPAFSSLRALAIHIFSFFGRRLCALLATSFVRGVAVSAVTPTSCCFFRPWLCALLACRACSLFASSAAFLLCPRRGLWPFLHVPYLGRASVCYWPVVMRSCFLSFFGPRLCALFPCPACMWPFRHYFYLPLLLPFPFSSSSFTRACPPAGGFSGYAPAAFCQPVSPPCSRPFLLLVAGRRLFWLRHLLPGAILLSSVRPAATFLVTCQPPSLSPPCCRAAAFLATCQPPSARHYTPSSGALRAGRGFSGYVPAAFCQSLSS